MDSRQEHDSPRKHSAREDVQIQSNGLMQAAISKHTNSMPADVEKEKTMHSKTENGILSYHTNSLSQNSEENVSSGYVRNNFFGTQSDNSNEEKLKSTVPVLSNRHGVTNRGFSYNEDHPEDQDDTSNQLASSNNQSDISSQNSSRSQSRVSFSEETKVAVFKRMDSLPVYETNFLKKMTSLRWKMCFMCCTIASLSITVRQCMSMAIVCMNGEKDQAVANFSLSNTSQNSIDMDEKDLYVQWDSRTEALVLSSYYYTFPLTPLLCGYLAGKFSPKYVTLAQILLMCAASIAIPFVAFISPAYVMVMRALVGFGSGGLMPCLIQILSKWAPRLERSQMTSIVNSGQSIGNIITFAFSGLICEIPIQGGWPFIFYIFTTCNLIGILLWARCMYNSPEEHPKADMHEIIYILRERRTSISKMPSPPWTKFLTSGPFWAVLAAHVSHAFIFTVIGTFLPLYMNDVLGYDAASNGLLSSLPFIGRFVGAMLVGVIADKCLHGNLMSTGCVRKLFQCIGMFGSAPFLIGLSFLSLEQRTLAVVLLVIYWTIQSSTNAAFRVNHLDIAPVYAGVINGTTLTCASVAALVAPLVTAVITKNGTREEWQIVFFVCAGIGILGTIVFCVLGSGEEQEWAKDPNLDIESDIRRVSLSYQSQTIHSSEDDNMDQSSFSLGMNRRKSSQKPLVSSGLTLNVNSIPIQANIAAVESQTSAVEKNTSVTNFNSNVSGISVISNPILAQLSQKDEPHSGYEHNSPESPTNSYTSYTSYGFENTTLDFNDMDQLSVHGNSSHSNASDVSSTSDDNIRKRNFKNLSLILPTNSNLSENTVS